MCVIMVADEGKIPSPVMIEKGFIQNPDGAGVAWRETEGEGDKQRVMVHWKKGIEDPDEVIDFVKDLPLPYVLHFRRASIGGKSLLLNHPYAVAPEANLLLQGKTPGAVLFHNGDWKSWQHWMLEAVIRKDLKLPDGLWNDSRTIAWLTFHYGTGFLDILEGQKGVLFGPTGYRSFAGGGWTKIDDVWCSNDKFLSVNLPRGGVTIPVRGPVGFQNNDNKNTSVRYCLFGECESENLDKHGYCPLHPNGVEINPPAPLIDAECGGAQQKVSPFYLGSGEPPTISAKRAFDLTQIVDGQGIRLVSMNLYKRIRGLYTAMYQADPLTPLGERQIKRIKKDLQAITAGLIQRGITITA